VAPAPRDVCRVELDPQRPGGVHLAVLERGKQPPEQPGELLLLGRGECREQAVLVGQVNGCDVIEQAQPFVGQPDELDAAVVRVVLADDDAAAR
jgi:hypothetical protein